MTDRVPQPAIVFISQLGTDGATWQPVIDRLSCGAPAVTYDRPGIGSCPPRPAPNPAIPYSVFADELAAHLEARGVTEPAVMVGHSVGSLIARVFADRHPHRIAGIVHVDGSIPRFHLLPGADTKPVSDGGTEIDTIAGEVEVLRVKVPRVPAVVVTRTPGWYDDQLPHPAIDNLWHIHQQLLADDWSAPLVVADNASHQVPAEAPGLVAHAVDAVMAAARSDALVKWDHNGLSIAGGRRAKP